MAPLLDHARPGWYSSVNKDFFSEETQKALLAPFKTGLRGYKLIKIQGHVNQDLARAVEKGIAQDQWSDPQVVRRDFAVEKDKGSALFRERKIGEASLIWQDAAVNIDKIIASSSWPTLVKRGGENFVTQLAELYFLVRINIAHVQITHMRSSNPSTASMGTVMAQDALHQAIRAMEKDYWKLGYRYVPEAQYLAKFRYRYALYMRLEGLPKNKQRALKHIDKAPELQPGDAAIVQERQNIIAWLQRGS